MTDDIMLLCGGAVYAVFAVIIIRQLKKECATDVSFGVYSLLLCLILPLIGEAVEFVLSLGDHIGENGQECITLLIKSLGITYITGVSAEICKGAGENGISEQIELFGRMEILLLCIPYFKRLLSVALI